jgi:hypothetical protein
MYDGSGIYMARAIMALSHVDVKELLKEMINQYKEELILAKDEDKIIYEKCNRNNRKGCIFSSLYFSFSLNDVTRKRIRDSLDKKEIIQDLTNFKIVGRGMSGVAISTDVNNDQILVIKTLQNVNELDNMSLLHEFIVASYCLNELRFLLFIPNFAYIYGIFDCIAPDFYRNRLVSICGVNINDMSIENGRNEEIVHHLVCEFINGNSFFSYIDKADLKSFLYNYIQILLALNTAGKYFSYTHYDLHTQNVIMRKFSDENFYVPCYLNNSSINSSNTKKDENVENKDENVEKEKKYFIESVDGYIPTIIDYGSNHVVIEGKHYGHYNMTANFFGDRMIPLADAYKLLISSLVHMVNKNKKLFSQTYLLAAYFNPDIEKYNKNEVIDEIAQQLKYDGLNLYASLPYTDNTAVNGEEFVQFIKKYGLNEKYLEGLNKRKLNDMDDYIQFCRDFCIKKGIKDPIVSEEEVTGKVLYSREGELFIR